MSVLCKISWLRDLLSKIQSNKLLREKLSFDVPAIKTENFSLMQIKDF